MKSIILTKIKVLRIYSKILIGFFLLYNAYFGWNRHPLTNLEASFDDIFKIGIYLWIGFIIHIILSYIEFKMNKYKTEINNK